ncbi:MAG: hypothetical protein OWR62_03935 [Sulfobacillus thermotolerans]|nr:hypothetical protein [Sulfobacillus thermotolerans]
MYKRWVLVIIGLLGVALPVRNAWAQSSPSIRLEMLVLLPERGRLAVYEQITWATRVRDPVIGILPQAQAIHTSTRASVEPGGILAMQGHSLQASARYDVPWNGRSGQYRLPAMSSIGTVALLIPQGVRAPAVLNPTWVLKERGKIPGVANGPVFKEYITTMVSAGESVPIVLEGKGEVGPTMSFQPQGPRWAMPTLSGLMMGLMVGVVLIVKRWRPVPSGQESGLADWDRLLRELAVLEAAHSRREVPRDFYEAERKELRHALAQSRGNLDG